MLVFAVSAMAQDTNLPVRKTVISLNPILAIFTWYNIELEYSATPHTTIGVQGSYITMKDQTDDDDILDIKYDDTFLVGTAFIRYYPVNSFKGFFIGGRFGIYNIEHKSDFETQEGTAYGAGVDLGYGWLLGAEQRVSVSMGLGAVRLFGGDLDNDDSDDVATVLPTIRLVNVGIAF
jgi:hypothetical protein